MCLLNGLAMSSRSWYAFVPQSQLQFDVILFDYWSQGNSFSEGVPYSIPCFCDALTQGQARGPQSDEHVDPDEVSERYLLSHENSISG